MELEFVSFPKIGRVSATATITEKIDGTNGQLLFNEEGRMLVGSRKREVFPEGTVWEEYADFPDKGTDNFGFALWAYARRPDLFKFLGPGRHYGEWAGQGIQRTYGMDEKRFYLFNTARFGPGRQEIPEHLAEQGLDSVPVLYEGPFGTDSAADAMTDLLLEGSRLNNFDNPEGIITYMHGLKVYSKMTFDNPNGKWRK